MVKQKKAKINPNKEGTFTKKFRENPWMVSTFILSALVIFLLTTEFIPEEEMIIKTEGDICSLIRVTPTWVDISGGMQEGYTNFNGEAPSSIVDKLIQNNVTFVYHEDCGYCKMQIEYFNESWDRYVDSGLTVNCKQ